jgi:signal transduction histidine kinase
MAYSVVFVVAFAAVLSASYFLVKHRTGGTKTAVSIICGKNGQIQAAFVGISTGPTGAGGGRSGGTIQAQPASGTCPSQVISASGTIVYGSGASGAAPSNTKALVPVPASLPAPGDPIASLITAVDASRDHTLNTYLFESVIALGLMGILSLGLGWWLAGRALRPVHRITDTARRLSEETLHDRINLDGPRDELKELADTFDAMLSRLDQAFTSQRRFVANASHELRTPLATERVLVDEALANPDASIEELRGILEQIRENSEESERLINALLTLARSGRSVERWSPVDLASVADLAQGRCAGEAAAQGVRVECELQAAPTGGDPGLLDRLAGNLVENSIRHNIAGGWMRLRTGSEKGQAFLEISNSGPVIEESAVGGLLEPFRRAGGDRSSGREGFGLGLSIVDAIVSAHGGRLSIRARQEGGVDVRVELRERAVVAGSRSLVARPVR